MTSELVRNWNRFNPPGFNLHGSMISRLMHLSVEPLVRKGVGRQLALEEIPNDLFGKGLFRPLVF